MKALDWLFFLGLFLVFLLPPTDPDLGWHLRYGQQIWAKKSLPRINEFSSLLEGYAWPDHYWFYQTVIYPIYKFSGLWGLTIFNALLMAAAFYLLYTAIKNFRLEKMLLILLTVYLGWGVFSFGIRSQLLGFFFFNLTLYLLTHITAQPRSNKHWMFVLLPLTMLLWANSHGSVILGLILTFSTTLHAIACKIDKNQKRKIVLTASLSFLATLINPFGFRIYREAWRHFAVVDLSKLIAEWVPPLPMVWWLIALSGAVLILYLLVDNRFSRAALLALFTYWGLKARRNVPFYFVLSSYIFLSTAKTKEVLAAWCRDKETRGYLSGLLVILLLAYGLLVRLPQTRSANLSFQNYVQTLPVGPPTRAIEFLKNQPEKERGNIFNRYEIGGFLIWQLPEYKVFVDGRMPAWPTPSGKSPYTIYLETLQTRPGWQETLSEYDIDWILISPGTFMDLKLKPDPGEFGWQEVYRDTTSVVYKKT